jgi:membrane-associated phospholipid phosphatase
MFLFSYLSLYPWIFKLRILAMVLLFTIMLPTFLIRMYRRYNGWTLIELGQKERRMVPYIISILCYFACIDLMELVHVPHFMVSIVIAALTVQMVCALVNMVWKISTHMAAIGGFAGALFVFADAFGFNPVWWFCLLFIVAGLLGSSRMILRQHTLSQVVAGFFVGMVCTVLAFLFL